MDRLDVIRENLKSGYYYHDRYAEEDLEYLLGEYDKIALYLLTKVALYELESD